MICVPRIRDLLQFIAVRTLEAPLLKMANSNFFPLPPAIHSTCVSREQIHGAKEAPSPWI